MQVTFYLDDPDLDRLRELDGVHLVGLRKDLRPPLIADFEIVQNGRFADGRRRFFLPSWPQPGLVPRDPARGDRITRLAYKGFLRNLHPDFRSRQWRDHLARRKIEWIIDAPDYSQGRVDPRIDWPDSRLVDLILAVRPADRRLHPA